MLKNILVVTTNKDVGVDFLIKKLRKLKTVKVFRFNVEEYPQNIKIKTEVGKHGETESTIIFPKQGILKTSEIFSAFYRREAEPILDSRINTKENKMFATVEAVGELDTLWDTINCFWVNHPRYSTSLMTKVGQISYAGKANFTVPKTIVSTEYKDLKKFYDECDGKVIAKQLGNARGAQDWIEGRLYTQKIERNHLEILKQCAKTPIMFQELIEKESELRITIVGDKIFAIKIDSQSTKNTKVDWRKGPVGNMKHTLIKLPTLIEKQLLNLHKILGLVYSGTDMIITPNGEYILLELNPNGEYVWTEVLTKAPITEEIVNLLIKGKTYHERGGKNPSVPGLN